ncbi:T9SS type A sorting domain-containing protein [Marivirga salinae]|uniref:T9SS type A sorting domain-containing protein n=1 Tax=Marivirga salinarum TaxID=3059078 RepID=A0AA51NC45_9BACT|nr:T9SS type A sorting domain-containing protein [Marivirga sp. BDSF4-3]WMN12696.1 T9SS type A sorting domain-containing protein [Marivirga sp. BDSF4-3]
MRIKAYYFFFCLFFVSIISFETLGADFLTGNSSVCTEGTKTETYSVSIIDLPTHTGNCEYYYTWRVDGGTILNGSTNATANGYQFRSIKVDWDENQTEYKVAVTVSNENGKGTCITGNLSASDLLLISENNDSCGGGSSGGDNGDDDSGDDDSGGDEDDEVSPFISEIFFQKLDESAEPFSSGSFCSDPHKLYFKAQNITLDGDYDKSISIRIGSEIKSTPLTPLEEGSLYDFVVDLDTLGLLEPTQVAFRCRMSGGDLKRAISKTFTFTILPNLNVEFTELMPPIHEGSGDAQIKVKNTNDNIDSLKLDLFTSGDIGVLSDYFGKTGDFVNFTGISMGEFSVQIQVGDRSEFPSGIDPSYCPKDYEITVPEPTTLNTFSISQENPECYGDDAVIKGNTNYDRDYYSNNPDIFYELYNDEDRLIDTVTVSPGQDFSFQVSPNHGNDNYYVRATKVGCENLSGENLEGFQIISENEVNVNFIERIEKTNLISNDESCYNSEDGKISFKISGGTPPYKIEVDNNSLKGISIDDFNNNIEKIPSGETVIIDGLAPDDENDKEISFIIFDSKQCKSDKINIKKRIHSVKEEIGISSDEVKKYPECLLGEDGEVKIVPKGGNGAPYELSVVSVTKSNGSSYNNETITANSDSSELFINNIPANCIIEYKVFDSNGCEGTKNFTFEVGDNPDALNFKNFDGGTDPDCFNGFGSVYLELTNFKDDLNNITKKLYNADDDNAEIDSVGTNHSGSTVSFTGLGEGNYYIEIKNSKTNCIIPIADLSFSIDIPDQPTFLPPISDDIPCRYGSMNVKLPMSSAKLPFKQFDLTIERKPSGEDHFTEADLDTVQIYPNSANELVIRNLFEGDYKISGTDGKGCAFKDFKFTLNQPDELLELTTSPHIKFSTDGTDYHISEYGVADGEINFEAEGGEFNYIFYLYKNNSQIESKTTNNEGSFDGLKALDDNGDLNEFYIGVSDSRNCFKRSKTFTLTQPDSLIFEYELINYISSENDTFNIECNGGADTVRVETEGGVYPHLVELLKGDNTEKSDTLYSQNEGSVFRDISYGRYKIKVTDKFDTNISSGYRKIIDIDSIDLVEPDSLSVDTVMTQPICYGDSTGSIIITPSGGVPFANGEYDIHLFDQDGGSILNETTNELSIVADAGIYYYTIFDAFNCEYVSEDEYFAGLGNKITVTELSPRLSVVEDTITYPPCAGDETATLSVNASGGRSEDGNYILELYDNNNPPLYGPNPLIDSVSTIESGYYTFQNLFAGEYNVIVYDDSLCSEMIPITIEERDYPLEFKIVDSVLARCPNSSDAKLKIISTGGDSPHIFSLNNIDFSPSDSITYSDDSTETYYHKTFTGLIGDSTYNIYLKDDNYYDGSFNNVCLIDTSQTIPKTPSLALDFEKTDIKCFGEENGDFTLSPSYGDMDNINDFIIVIDGPNSVVSHDQGYVNNLSAGRYKIKITLADTTACKTPLDEEIYIDQPEPLVVDIFSNTEYNCSSDEEIILNGEINGGLSTSDQFLYAINSDNSADFELLEVSKSEFRIKEKLEPGWNVFYLKSSHNCMVSDSFFVESEQPNLQIIANQAVSCFGKSDGEIRVTSNFEKLNYKLMNYEDTFSIDDSEAENVVFEGLKSGNYQLTGSSSSCLADTLEIFVNQPDSLMFSPEIIDQPSCNQANGIGSLSISGGTSPYEIFWQLENGNILDSTSLKSGYYDIIVEDANNCSAILTDFFVEESNDFMVSVDTLSNPTCGKNNGSISIQTIGGVPPFDIIWFKNGDLFTDGTDSLTSLSAGTYIYSVEDAMGCVFEDSVKLNGSEPISIDILDQMLADCDTQNGSITLSVTGGTPPYTYSWPDSIPYAEGNYAEGLWGAKIYTVSVTDANLCSKEYEFAIGNKGAPEIAVHATNPKCDFANGKIEIELLSEDHVSYEWRGFENASSTLENVPSGIYFVTLTANNCPITKRIELTENTTNLLEVNPILTKAGCNDMGGEIDLNISGGTQPYTITWDDTLLKNDVRSGLSSGNYSFKVTDSVGCIVSKDIYLDKEELPQLSLNSLGNAACGATDGYIQLDSLSSEFTFKWSHNNLLNDDLAENLSSGLYSVYAVNQKGCTTDTVSYYISSSNTDLRIQEIDVISASCNESADGSIEVNAVNGVPPYQYEWNDDDQQTGKIAKDLRPGTYTVRVTDATNCSRVKSITLGQVNPVHILSVSKNAPSCTDAADGSISITAAGGKGNYSYEWSTGATTPSITGLESGEYSVTVYDNNVCSDQIDVSITAPDMLSVEYSTEKPKCYSTADGQVELSVLGGIPPYKVEWHDGATLNRRFDLAAGSYNVFISDNNNCSINKNIIVPAKDSVTIDYEITSVSCNGGNDGNVRIQSISNANNPKVVWSNGQIGNTLRNVSSGFYAADITDSYGCTTAFEFGVDSPDPLQIVNDSVTNVLCKNGFNGSIIFDVKGGNGNYSFNWDDGPRNKNRYNLTAGNYKVTVLDDLNCRIEKQFTIDEPNLLVLDYTAASVSCFGNADGYVSLEINGGIEPYQISWDDGVMDSVRNDLTAGTHDVLVKDANNCSKSIEVSIPNINPIRIDEVIQTIPSCYQGSDGGLELEISGGNAPYTVSWDNGKSGASIDSISAGNYRVTIKDNKNCQLTELIALEDASPIYLTSLTMANPICYGEPSGVVEVVPDGGNPPFEVIWEDGTSAFNRGDLLAGSHTFEVVDSTGCSVSYKISLQDPPLEVIEGLPSEIVLCTGGVANLDAGEWNSYNWTADNGFSRSEREVTIDAVGNYNLAVTNEAGCIDNHPFTVTKDDDLLTADFLLTTEAVVQDTVVIVDVSWKVPDSVRWINPDDPDFYLVSQTEEYQEVIFTRTGDFELKMKAKLDYCESDVIKTITVLSKEEAARISDEEKNIISKDLHISTSIYPNPNFGDFRIEMKGNKQYDHHSKIIDVNSGIEYYRFEGKKQKNYVFNIEDNRLPDGVYLLMMETEGETITKRFIVK